MKHHVNAPPASCPFANPRAVHDALGRGTFLLSVGSWRQPKPARRVSPPPESLGRAARACGCGVGGGRRRPRLKAPTFNASGGGLSPFCDGLHPTRRQRPPMQRPTLGLPIPSLTDTLHAPSHTPTGATAAHSNAPGRQQPSPRAIPRGALSPAVGSSSSSRKDGEDKTARAALGGTGSAGGGGRGGDRRRVRALACVVGGFRAPRRHGPRSGGGGLGG